MIYLIDENMLITAKNQYYKFEQVHEYWEWLLDLENNDKIKIPIECYNKMSAGSDELAKWLRKHHDPLIYKSELPHAILQKVLNEGYGEDLNEIEIAKINTDPYLIAHAYNGGHTVVTLEVSNSSKTRSNAKIPDVSKKFGIQCISPFELNDELEFSTSWNQRKI